MDWRIPRTCCVCWRNQQNGGLAKQNGGLAKVDQLEYRSSIRRSGGTLRVIALVIDVVHAMGLCVPSVQSVEQ